MLSGDHGRAGTGLEGCSHKPGDEGGPRSQKKGGRGRRGGRSSQVLQRQLELRLLGSESRKEQISAFLWPQPRGCRAFGGEGRGRAVARAGVSWGGAGHCPKWSWPWCEGSHGAASAIFITWSLPNNKTQSSMVRVTPDQGHGLQSSAISCE